MPCKPIMYGHLPSDLTTVGGAALKFGYGTLINPTNTMAPVTPEIADPDVRFYVNSPKNIPVDRRVRETFPLRNYVFFDLGSKEIPDRYVLLSRDQVKDFKEDQLEVFAPKKLSGRSSRQMVVYYNVLNILGDRLGKNPASTITLVGSSEKGPEDGKAMATSIKEYLGNVFRIDGSRISVEGRNKPVLPSEQPNSGSDNMPGKTIMGTRLQGDYKVTMVGKTKSGTTVRKDANMNMVLWTPGKSAMKPTTKNYHWPVPMM